MSTLQAVQARLRFCREQQNKGESGYGPAIEFYTSIVNYIKELELKLKDEK